MNLPYPTDDMSTEDKARTIVDGMEMLAGSIGQSLYGEHYERTLDFIKRTPYSQTDDGEMDKAIKVVILGRKALHDLEALNS